MSMKTLLVVNPASGNGNTGRGWTKSELLLRRHLEFPFDVALTQSPGHATRIVREAVGRGVDRIVSVGGDGTLNEVVNGLFDGEHPQASETILGTIGLGTGSDFIKTLGWRPGLEFAAEKLNQGTVRRIDAAHVRFRTFDGSKAGRTFINVADFGAGGAVVERVNRTTKRFGGAASFLWGIVATLLTYKNKLISYRVAQGLEQSEILSNVIVGNGCYYGGGIKAAPTASLNNGTLSIVFVGDFKWLETLVNLPRFRAGRHLTHRKV
ncbi:MAG: diacylglycerol kinase family lipid kinase, partial [Deltaproteobacteria bacterium]|nr:diacylglycerol kinase family lipid kinase [Deltaproteobacteria bacterium]